ncbi:MAG TPA: cation diffusion facilitator family transporter [Burkholderiales bacterium]|nr:cation diffusion facilitator family transporter [Burkholderiales bacterium]
MSDDHPGHDHHERDHHEHGHAHPASNFGRAFAIGIALNMVFVAVEIVFGLLGNSVALLADAFHNLSDVFGLVIAWVATVLSRQPPSTRFTYGLRGTSILAALGNALFLLVTVGAIAWEAIQRLWHPEPVAAAMVIAVAAVGIAINGATALLFASGRKGDINIRGAFLHMAADAAVSAGVVVAGIGTLATGWLWLDPVASLVIVLVIVWGTWGLLKESAVMSLAAVPQGIDRRAVESYLAALPGVTAVHDLHIWAMSTTETALTGHLVIPQGHPGDAFLLRVCDELNGKFRIGHATLQIEISADAACRLSSADIV